MAKTSEESMEEVNWTIVGVSFLAMSAAIYVIMESISAVAKKFGFKESSLFARLQPLMPSVLGVPLFMGVGPSIMDPAEFHLAIYACLGVLGGNLSSNAYGIWKQSIKGADARIQDKIATLGDEESESEEVDNTPPSLDDETPDLSADTPVTVELDDDMDVETEEPTE
jgi:hypothetical protein